jgi:hypothetical protein
MLIIKLLIVAIILSIIYATTTKSKSSAAIPKAKKGNKSYIGFGILNKVYREAKARFCSELESYALQVGDFYLHL